MNDDLPYEHTEDALEIKESSDYGTIQINNDVVANIVAMTARDVPGVHSLVGGGFGEDIRGFLGKRKDKVAGSVSITENSDKAYVISLKLVLTFGVELAKVAHQVQVSVKEQVQNMTNKEVAKVNIIVEDVHASSDAPEEEE